MINLRIIISKILNKTDLGKSGSHGELVVTKNVKKTVYDFFEEPNVDRIFINKEDDEKYKIHYANYTETNKSTPNDHVAPIGRYANKYQLNPGDELIFEKRIDGTEKSYLISYLKKFESTYFVGKSGTSVDSLNYDHFVEIMADNIASGKVKQISADICKVQVKYMGMIGELTIERDGKEFELNFEGIILGGNKKYYELDTSIEPFELHRMDTWNIKFEVDPVVSKDNEVADEELIREMSNTTIEAAIKDYVPTPEKPKAAKKVNERTTAVRDKKRAGNALARAYFLCEFDEEHRFFLRKNQPVYYTEPHHLIPLKYQELFEFSLDVEANIVSLCSCCHDRVHYGADADMILSKLWRMREKELVSAGLGKTKNGENVTYEMLMKFYDIG